MIDDKELIRKFTSGDEKAFDQIVQKNLNNVFGFFMKITRDEMAAEDLTQDVFLKLYKNLKNFRYESNFSTYLYRINSNTANSWITRNKWKSMLHLEQIAEEGKDDQKNEQHIFWLDDPILGKYNKLQLEFYKKRDSRLS